MSTNLQQQIENSLEQINKIFPVQAILNQEVTKSFIRNYHTYSSWGYKYLHSREGSLHLAMNYEGYFTPQGFYEQTRIIHQFLEAYPAHTQVLELGSGNGFNTIDLAKKNPQRHFTGLDLTPASLRTARQKSAKLSNTRFTEGDFQQLPFGDESFDVVFEIEALSHANQPQKALQEAYRVLKPNGLLIAIDGFRYPNFEQQPTSIQKAAQLVEITMAVQQGVEIQDWIKMANQIGFALQEQADYSAFVIPNLTRLCNMAKEYFYPTWRAKLLKLLLPTHLAKNAVAGLLIGATVKAKAQGYFKVVLQK